jgi:hypothetical protein
MPDRLVLHYLTPILGLGLSMPLRFRMNNDHSNLYPIIIDIKG